MPKTVMPCNSGFQNVRGPGRSWNGRGECGRGGEGRGGVGEQQVTSESAERTKKKRFGEGRGKEEVKLGM